MAGQRITNVSLRAFGKFVLYRDDREISVAGVKTRALLAYLACQAGKPQSRDRLIGLLWGDRFEAQARQSLRHTLSELRKVVGADALKADRDLVCLTSAFQSDVAQFKWLLSSGKPDDRRAALALYQDELLADVSLREKPFMDWLAAERARLRDLAIDAIGQLIDSAAESLSAQERLSLAQRAVALDPYREQAHRQLLRTLAELGRRNDALAHYRQLVSALRAELGVEPEPATRALFESLRAGPTTDGSRDTPLDHRHWNQVRKPSIAILPFANMSGDPDRQYFSDGITEDIITELSRWRQLEVISRHASFQYRGESLDSRRIGRELGVDYIVEGSVRLIGERIRVTAQLVDAVSATHLWAERYDRDLKDIFAVQDEVVQTIVSTLVGRVQAAGAEQAKRKPPSSLAAYECVLRGDSLQIGDEKAEAEARRLYEKAIELDPTYARAYALLAISAHVQWFKEASCSDAALDWALELARKAVELDANDSFCWASLGYVYLQRRTFDLAATYLQSALEMNPNNPVHVALYGDLLTYEGRPNDAIEWYDQARRLDRFRPTWHWRHVGIALFAARRYDDAIAAFDRSPIRPFWVHAYVAACHAQSGRSELARKSGAEVVRLRPDFSLAMLSRKEPFKLQSDVEHLLEGLRRAGLPE